MLDANEREMHLIKKALAIAVLAIEARPGPLQSSSDQFEMKVLLDRLAGRDAEIEFYARAARIAFFGNAD